MNLQDSRRDGGKVRFHPSTRLSTYRSLAAALLAALSTLSLEAASLAPRVDWRAKPDRIGSSGDAGSLVPLRSGRTCEWKPGGAGQEHWIAFRFADTVRSLVMLTFSASHPVETAVEVSFNTTDGRNGSWRTLHTALSGPFLNKVDLEPSIGAWLRVRFRGEGTGRLRIWNLGLYAPRRGERSDYWLALGASIQHQSMRHARFNPLIRRRHPRADPVLFNLAVRGWGSGDLLGNLPALLEQHPYAGYALVHVGGNDVSSMRPYPGGAWILESNLEAILDTLQAAGIVPVLARLSYRRYKGAYTVPPEENGSGPYVTGLYDPICARRTPHFFDAATGRCAVDFYSLFVRNPGELAADGVHLNVLGEESWAGEWARVVGPLVYDGRPPSPPAWASAGILRSRTRRPIVFGGFPAGTLAPWRLEVRDLSGRLVFRSTHGGWGAEKRPIWTTVDMTGRPVPGGIYYYTLRLGSRVDRGSMLVMP